MGKYIGETEKNLQRLFDSASAPAPYCSSTKRRRCSAGAGREGQPRPPRERDSGVAAGADEGLSGVAVLATTSREEIDSAFLERIRHVCRSRARLRGGNRYSHNAGRRGGRWI